MASASGETESEASSGKVDFSRKRSEILTSPHLQLI
ncbi:unnamed protein product [Rhodiola kirilowii]